MERKRSTRKVAAEDAAWGFVPDAKRPPACAGGPMERFLALAYLAPTISLIFSAGVLSSRRSSEGRLSESFLPLRSSWARSLRASSSKPRSLRV